MNKSRIPITLFAALFILLGLSWLKNIHDRSEEILRKFPAQLHSAFTEGTGPSSHAIPLSAQGVLAKVKNFFLWIKEFYFINKPDLVWIRVFSLVEILGGFMYIMSGVSLARLYPFAIRFVRMTLALDVFCKILIGFYILSRGFFWMSFRGHEDILLAFFITCWAKAVWVSGHLSLLGGLKGAFVLYGIFYVLYLGFVLGSFSRPSIQIQFRK